MDIEKEELAIIEELRSYDNRPPPKRVWLELANRLEAIRGKRLVKSDAQAKTLNISNTYVVNNSERLRQAIIDIAAEARKGRGYKTNCEIRKDAALEEITDICLRAFSSLPRNCDRFDGNIAPLYREFTAYMEKKGYGTKNMAVLDAFNWLLSQVGGAP